MLKTMRKHMHKMLQSIDMSGNYLDKISKQAKGKKQKYKNEGDTFVMLHEEKGTKYRTISRENQQLTG